MATSLQQLLDRLAVTAEATPAGAAIEDITGALGHLGRALTGLALDGLTPDGGPRDRATAGLGAACTAVGALWPATGGTLTDLAGAAADLVGRDRDVLGRSQRWAITVELAERADHCARLAHRLLPRAAVAELAAVHRLAAAVERDAVTDPPTAAGSVALDRPVPMTDWRGEASPLDASAALIAALDHAQRTDQLMLRDFRAALAAGETVSRHAAAVTAAATGAEPGPLLVPAAAWQLTSRISMAFEDGRRTRVTHPHGVVASAHALAEQLHDAVGSHTDISALRKPPDFVAAADRVQEVANQLPVLADRLAAAVEHWGSTGQLYAFARDLPPMEDMPEERVRRVVAGHRVPAVGADVDRLRQAVNRAGELSAALADVVNSADQAGRLGQRHLAGRYAEQVRASGAAELLLSHAQAVTEALAVAKFPRTSPSPGQYHAERPGI